MSLAALLVKPVAERGPPLTEEAFVVGSVAVVAGGAEKRCAGLGEKM
jgi:hypothetical protein